MKLSGTTAFVTGANRGLGRHFAQELLARGAKKVYAAARNPDAIDLPGVEKIRLDITAPAAVAAAVAQAPDVDLLINNAGIGGTDNLISGDLDEIRRQLETHFFGTLGMVRGFAPVLGTNGGGAVLNVLSVLSLVSMPEAGAYAAAKAAQLSLTNSIRYELAAQGTLVSGLLLAATDTDMMAGYDVPKNDPADVIRTALDGLEADLTEILADEPTRQAKASLAG
ncbi:SDR family oxidoreductase [Kribbella sp. NPDC051770]|uniref:SDR family oxidoreductase n=1 Tax=Kribbella sp. NPDC051770 TaxID=3155413 RepID=UPI003437EEA6